MRKLIISLGDTFLFIEKHDNWPNLFSITTHKDGAIVTDDTFTAQELQDAVDVLLYIQENWTE